MGGTAENCTELLFSGNSLGNYNEIPSKLLRNSFEDVTEEIPLFSSSHLEDDHIDMEVTILVKKMPVIVIVRKMIQNIQITLMNKMMKRLLLQSSQPQIHLHGLVQVRAKKLIKLIIKIKLIKIVVHLMGHMI